MVNKRGIERRAALLLGACAIAAVTVPSAGAQPAASTSAPGKARIGIIGSGHIGSTVGSLWVQAGHPVLFSSRHPEQLKPMVDRLGSLAQAGTPQDAAAFGDIVFIAVPYGAMPTIGSQLAPALSGKILIDAGNAVASRDGDAMTLVREKGIGLATASLFPGARVVRAFNVLNYTILQAQAHRAGAPLAVPIAGDDAQALEVVAGLVRDAGFEPVVVGALARATEFAQGGPGYGKEVDAAALRQLLGLAPAQPR
jgi:predicted dinucleotide-binding enzyme